MVNKEKQTVHHINIAKYTKHINKIAQSASNPEGVQTEQRFHIQIKNNNTPIV